MVTCPHSPSWQYSLYIHFCIENISISFVDANPTLLQTVEDQLFVVFEGDLSVLVGVCHFHPARDVFRFGREIDPHLFVGFLQKLRDLLLTQVPVLVLVELEEEPFGHIQALFYVFGVGSGIGVGGYLVSGLAKNLTAKA